MTNRFTQKAQNTLNHSLQYASDMGHSYVGTEHILLGLLHESDGVAAKLLTQRGATIEKIKNLIIESIGTGDASRISAADMTPRTRKLIEISAIESSRHGDSYIGTEHLLLGLLADSDCVAVKILSRAGVNLRDLRQDVFEFFGRYSAGESRGESSASQSERENVRGQKKQKEDIPGAPTISSYGRDLTAAAKEGRIDPIIGRDEEMERVIQILSRRQKNNPCLIGEPGVGKTAVVEGLAQKIIEGNVPETLKGRTVVTLDIPSMIAGAKYRGEFEERLKNVMEEAQKNPSIILFIDEFHTLVGAGAAEGAIDAANILKPALSRGEIQIIGATTISEYRKHIEKDAALERRFQSVTVGEPSPSEAVEILKGLRGKYEAHHKLKISDEAIEAAVSLSVRYISDRYLPDKAIDLIDEAASKLRISSLTSPPDLKALEDKADEITRNKEEAIRAQDFEGAAKLRDEEKAAREKFEEEKKLWEEKQSGDDLVVGETEIADIVTAWTKIPVQKLLEEESEKLLRLDSILHERIIGQDDAVDAIARAIKRGRIGLKNPKRPIGSFIFLGPTGVGKTELTKALADVMFGDENAMIRIDMSEYMEKHSVSKLIGSPPGYVGFEEGGQLTEKIRRHPYSVVLFDEIEKAHPDVFNILLQILEDGILTDSQGRRVDFKNTVIIMTSNVGAEGMTVKKSALGFAPSDSSESEKDSVREGVMAALKATFRPEFLNRLDEIIVFNKLTETDIEAITRIMLKELTVRIESLGVNITFSDEAVTLLAKEGFDPIYGARPLRRAITRKIEDSFSEKMLEGKIKSGDSVTAVVKDGEIFYKK
ncbi:MAG: ATP-dependent Clp protease ATP-binding subunit [Clostridia bacterium]|nr:ATP-dependent Clp protease ATP-binding subunit [Clostridia bacterium]